MVRKLLGKESSSNKQKYKKSSHPVSHNNLIKRESSLSLRKWVKSENFMVY